MARFLPLCSPRLSPAVKGPHLETSDGFTRESLLLPTSAGGLNVEFIGKSAR
jgi:hypothetical protein